MNPQTTRISIAGPVGAIEVALDSPPDTAPRGLAIVAHPHPLFGGALDNKVTQTLARSFLQLGYLTARANFRGVGATAGTHDAGNGETDDLLALIAHLQAEHQLAEVVLGGFSFGSYVQSRVAARLAERGAPASWMVLVGTPPGKWNVLNVPSDTLVIHGELDETIPLSAVLDWARPQELPVVVMPGADHFFHHRLTIIRRLVVAAWYGNRGMAAVRK